MKEFAFIPVILLFIVLPTSGKEPNEPIQLTCSVTSNDGTKLPPMSIETNETEGSVTYTSSGIKFPATFSDTSIRWKIGKKLPTEDLWFHLEIDRMTGDFTMMSAEFPDRPFHSGVCSVTDLTKRKF